MCLLEIVTSRLVHVQKCCRREILTHFEGSLFAYGGIRTQCNALHLQLPVDGILTPQVVGQYLPMLHSPRKLLVFLGTLTLLTKESESIA